MSGSGGGGGGAKQDVPQWRLDMQEAIRKRDREYEKDPDNYKDNAKFYTRFVCEATTILLRKMYVMLDVSGSMTMVLDRVRQYLDGLAQYCRVNGIKLVIVPFGANEKEWNGPAHVKHMENYSPCVYDEWCARNVPWAKFGTSPYLLVQFLRSKFNTEPYGLMFIGDGQFTGSYSQPQPEKPFLDALKDAATHGKLNNCGFLHFVYFQTGRCTYSCRKYRHECQDCIRRNQEVGVGLKRAFQQVLSLVSNVAVPYSEGESTASGFPTSIVECPEGYFAVGYYLFNINLMPQTLVKYLLRINTQPKFRNLLPTLVEYMIGAMVANPELFLNDASVYSTIHRLLSLAKDMPLTDLMNSDDIPELVATAARKWGCDSAVFGETPTVNSLYMQRIDEWANRQTNKIEIYRCLSQLRSKAFGGQKDYLGWLARNTATHLIFIPLRIAKMIATANQFAMRDYCEMLPKLFDVMQVVPVGGAAAAAAVADSTKVLLTYVSADPYCSWNTLNTMIKILKVDLSTTKTFILGCFIEKYKEKFPALYHLINTNRFTDNDVIKGVFMDRKDDGTWYFKKDILSTHLVGILLDFINAKDLTFESLTTILIPFLKTKAAYERTLSVINQICATARLSNLVLKSGGLEVQPYSGKFAIMYYSLSPDDHVPSFVALRISRKDGKVMLMYVDAPPDTKHSEIFNKDFHVCDGRRHGHMRDRGCKIVGNKLFDRQDTEIGQMFDYSPINLRSSNWKTKPYLQEINAILMAEMRKYRLGDYSTNHDEVMARIHSLLQGREDKILAAAVASATGSVASKYIRKLVTIKIATVMQIVGIPDSQHALFTKGHFNMADFHQHPGIQFVNLSKTLFGGGADAAGGGADAADVDAPFQVPVDWCDVDGGPLVWTRKSILHSDGLECAICDGPVVHGLGKVTTLECGCEIAICSRCHGDQRNAFLRAATTGAELPITSFKCYQCAKPSNTLYKLITSGYYPTEAFMNAVKLAFTMTPSGKIFGCKNSCAPKRCHGFVSQSEIGCLQAGAEGIFACEKCNVSTAAILIQCPGCGNLMTHDGLSCNLMRCCIGGYHAHDNVSREDCTHCGPGTDFCGGKFRLSREVQEIVSVTASYNFGGYQEVGLECLWYLLSDGRVVPYSAAVTE